VKRLPIYWNLILDFSRRDIEKKYRGSFLGLFWTFLSPLLMLGVYTFVYSYVLQVRVGGMDRMDFVIWLYAGLTVFFFFSDVAITAPATIRSVPNYVKKVIFPLEILVSSRIVVAFFSFTINFCLLIILFWLKHHAVHGTVLWTPLILLPTMIFTYGLALILASVGVFVRDVDELSRFFIRVLFYLAPIVYPLTFVPERFYSVIWMNPLTSMVENFRRIVFFGFMPDWQQFIGFFVVSIIIFLLGRSCFIKLRPAFADVL
jgi:lipopolysaccharide transport system permease protein